MALRYGNAIKLGQSEKPEVYISANPQPMPHSFPDFITTMRENPDTFVVLKDGGHATAEPIKFGDSVKLVSKKRSPPGYLAFKHIDVEMWDYSDGRIVSVVTEAHEAQGTLWKILNAADPASKAVVNFGDTVVFENTIQDVKHYLSCGYNMTHPGASVPRVTLREERGGKEKWIISKAPFLLDEMDFSPVINVPGSDTASNLPTGLTVQKAVMGIVGGIPKIGAPVAAVMKIFWEEDKVDIWALIKDQVAALVKDYVFEQKLIDFKVTLNAVKEDFKKYLKLKEPAEKGIKLSIALSNLDHFKDQLVEAEKPEKTLPYLIGTAVLHITALRERYLHGEELYGGDADKETHHEELLQYIAFYQDVAAKARENLLKQRRSFVTLKEEVEEHIPDYRVFDRTRTYTYDWKFNDTYTGEEQKWRLPNVEADSGHINNFRTAANNKLKNHLAQHMPLFTEKLDDMLAPIKVLPYMDPKNDNIPIKVGKYWE